MILVNNPKLYVPNNIIFRIGSSKLLESFKATQHFILTEMQYGQYNFSRTSKEIALLYGDAVFKSLLLIERIFIETKKEIVDSSLALNIIKVLLSQLEYTVTVTSLNKDIFDSKHVDLWKRVHLPVSKIVERVIEDTIGDTIEESFKKLVLILIDSMDSIRFEQNEIDFLIKNGKIPFLNVVDLCAISASYIREPILVTRAKEYNRFMGREMTYRVKNYASSYSFYKLCISGLENANISLIKNKDIKDVTKEN